MNPGSLSSFDRELDLAQRFLIKAHGHLRDYAHINPYDPSDAHHEFLYAMEDLRIARLHVERAAQLVGTLNPLRLRSVKGRE